VQPDRDVAGIRVTERVLQRLLRDAEDLPVAGRVGGQLVVHVELDLTLMQSAQHLDVLAQRAAEPVLGQVGRA
jgi:hypothetical protein